MRKLFTLAAALLASFSLWAAEPSLTLTAKSSVIGDWNKTYDNVTISVQGAAFASKKPCGVSTNENAMSVSSADGQWIEISCPDGLNKVVFVGSGNSTGTTDYAAPLCVCTAAPFDSTITDIIEVHYTGYDKDCIENEIALPAGTKSVRLYRRMKVNGDGTKVGTGSNWAPASATGNQTYNITYVEVYANAATPDCTSPQLTLRGDTTIYVEDGNTIDLQTAHIGTGGLQVAVKKDGAEAEYDVDYTLTMAKNFKALKKGVYEITVKHVASGEFCDEEATVTITALEKEPVTTASITGPTTAVIGQKITLTGSTDVPATNVWWTDQYGTTLGNEATLEYTCNAKGTLKFNFWAENAFNTEPAMSAEHEVVVTKLCGELIKATHKAAKTADVTGVVGGTVDKNTQDGGKLGSNGHYFGVKLAEGTFMPGDVVTITATTASALVQIFSDKGETLINEGTFTDLVYTYTLTEITEWIYLYRTEAGGSSMNPTLGSIAVTRPCEDSNDATIHSLTVNGNEVAENDGVFEYTLSASYTDPTVEVAFEIHPLATIKYGLSNPYEMNTPGVGESNGQAFTIIAEDGTEKTYTVLIHKSASLSNDATLKELSVEGFNLNVEFDPEVVEYSIYKDYTAEYPADSLITATPNDANAKSVNITFNEGVFTIVVTAEDEATTKTYTITVNNRLARKDLLRVAFSNGAIGFVSGYNIRVPYMAGEEVPTFASATFWNPEGTATAEMLGEQLKVTGVDGVYNLYTIEPVAVSPMVANYEEITFDTVPSYIFSIYGWDAEKGVKFSKDVEEASNHRISEGKDRIYFALPAAKELILTSGSGAERPVTITVNGVASSVAKTAKKNETITIELDGTKNNFVAIESNKNGGDAGFTKMQLVEAIPTAIDNTNDEVKAVKIIRDGQLFIQKNGVLYNAQGAVVK